MEHSNDIIPPGRWAGKTVREPSEIFKQKTAHEQGKENALGIVGQ